MIVFVHMLRRLLRKKVNLLFMLAIPIGMTALIMLFWGNAGSSRVGIADNDGTRLTAMLRDRLSANCKVVVLKEEEVKSALLDSRVDYAFVINSGFTDALIAGSDAQVSGFRIKETDTGASVRFGIDSFLNAARNIAAASGNNTERFYSGMEDYLRGNFTVDQQWSRDKRVDIAKTSQSMGFLVMSMLLLSTYAPAILLEDMKKKTFYRVLSAPIAMKNFMLQCVAAFLAISLIQVGAVVILYRYVFGAYMGPSIGNLLVLLAVFSIVSVSLGVCVNAIAREERLAGLVTTLISTPMCMLGGCFWPMDFMPAVLRRIGDFVPTSWMMKAVAKELSGQPLSSMTAEIGIMLLFALVFFLLGTWRKVEVAK